MGKENLKTFMESTFCKKHTALEPFIKLCRSLDCPDKSCLEKFLGSAFLESIKVPLELERILLVLLALFPKELLVSSDLITGIRVLDIDYRSDNDRLLSLIEWLESKADLASCFPEWKGYLPLEPFLPEASEILENANSTASGSSDDSDEEEDCIHFKGFKSL